MLQSKKQLKVRNSGWLDIYRAPAVSSDFGAPANVRRVADMEHVVRLAYTLQSKRQEDVELAERAEFNLSLKAGTRRVAGIDCGCKAVTGGTLYDIAYIDDDGRTSLYLYLSEVGSVDTQ